MRWIACLFAGALATAPAPAFAQPADPDPFAASAQDGEVERMVHASVLGVPGADAAIAAWLTANPDASAADHAALYRRLCGAYGLRTWYGQAEQACREGARHGSHSESGARLAAAFATTSPVRAIGATFVNLSDNPLGSKSADVTANGVTLPWFMDTGAEISVLSQSSADRLDVRYMADSIQVGTSTNPVEGRVAVVDLLRIGDASVENVPVLVLPDAQLTAGSFRIPAILGLQVFVAFRRMAWLDGGSRIALGDDAPAIKQTVHRIYWHEDGLGIPVEIGGLVRGAHFDSGANYSFLWAPGLALLTADQKAALVIRTFRVGGAGGVVERQSEELPIWHSAIAGVPIALKCVTLDEQRSAGVARIGSDVLPQLRSLAFDFEAMTIAAEPMPQNAPDSAATSPCP